jgi:Protein of unknown function (DUF3761)
MPIVITALVSAFLILSPLSPTWAGEAQSHPAAGSDSEFYTNVDGNRIHRPLRSDQKPLGATAHCRDGSWSFSAHHRGTCSHHGGVASWE